MILKRAMSATVPAVATLVKFPEKARNNNYDESLCGSRYYEEEGKRWAAIEVVGREEGEEKRMEGDTHGSVKLASSS
ncbi:hypothetical protein HPB47_024168 [Ixodes persulcatus]|uniref:Uncharacterized protein n=1 Tax=Ixodes persulcatus TaxID=34615 RepID=A0AC60Q5I6_IXOPE|nr:hypothetical protein HPB47_024168 [Ixodes persulcatus]